MCLPGASENRTGPQTNIHGKGKQTGDNEREGGVKIQSEMRKHSLPESVVDHKQNYFFPFTQNSSLRIFKYNFSSPLHSKHLPYWHHLRRSDIIFTNCNTAM